MTEVTLPAAYKRVKEARVELRDALRVFKQATTSVDPGYATTGKEYLDAIQDLGGNAQAWTICMLVHNSDAPDVLRRTRAALSYLKKRGQVTVRNGVWSVK